MIRLKNILPKAFLIAVVEMVNMDGVEKTYTLLNSIGSELADIEGPGFEGAWEDDINYLPICPFGNELIDFNNIYGETPHQFTELINYVNKLKEESEEPWNFPALSSVLGILQYSYTHRRAELAEAKIYNVGSKSAVNNIKVYNEEAIEKTGMTKESVSEILNHAFCVYKVEYHQKSNI
ncbi:hypothetical protein [Methanolobus sp. WCC5]|jgi:hypothetical protein|uniref:hypothetical protein n=1 Tax=Methanolobus sp. WCC5 TaxID=3125785 RepID=UPI00324EE23E